MMRRKIKLGLSMRGIGYHSAAWRHPEVPAGGSMDIGHFVGVAQAAERGLFDMVFLADGIGIRGVDKPAGALCRSNLNAELEPLTLLSALAMTTRHIGLVATASTTYNEPYHIARKFSLAGPYQPGPGRVEHGDVLVGRRGVEFQSGPAFRVRDALCAGARVRRCGHRAVG